MVKFWPQLLLTNERIRYWPEDPIYKLDSLFAGKLRSPIVAGRDSGPGKNPEVSKGPGCGNEFLRDPIWSELKKVRYEKKQLVVAVAAISRNRNEPVNIFGAKIWKVTFWTKKNSLRKKLNTWPKTVKNSLPAQDSLLFAKFEIF